MSGSRGNTTTASKNAPASLVQLLPALAWDSAHWANQRLALGPCKKRGCQSHNGRCGRVENHPATR